MKAYRCRVEFNNGAVIEEKVLIVFTPYVDKITSICEDLLCKHNDDSIEMISIKLINIPKDAVGFVVEE